MPSGISQSAANPVALVPRPAAQPRTQEPATTAGAQNAQAVLATGGNEVVRAPEPNPGAQRADDQSDATGADRISEQAEPRGAQKATASGLQMDIDRGLGGNIDITA